MKVSSGGVVKLLDFGIAKDGASHGLTQTGGVIGTPTYLSPEQLSGQPATAQADIWALGVLFYEMLTGQPPFKGDTLGGLVLQITKAEFTAPEAVNSAVSREAAGIVKKCLKREAAGRYQTADELLSAVRKAVNSRQDKSRTGLKKTLGLQREDPPALPGTIVVTEQAVKPFPTGLIALAGSAVVLVFIIAIAGIWMMSGTGETTRTATAAGNLVPATSKGNMRVRVDVDEGKAMVLRNGQSLGTTPLDLDANLGESVPLTLRREGYEDKSVSIDITNGKKVFTFALKAK